MSRRLPPDAHLDHLKKQAKDLLRAHRSGEPAAVKRFRACLNRLSGHEENSIEPVSLQEAQYVVAREYGFVNWSGLLADLSSYEQVSTLSAVRAIHDRLSPDLQTLLTRILGRKIEVAIVEAHQLTFARYVQSLGERCWNYCFHIDRVKGGNIAFSLPLISAILRPDAGREEVRHLVESMRANGCTTLRSSTGFPANWIVGEG